VDRGGSWASVRADDGTILRVARSLVDGIDDVEVGVRPEKIRISDDADAVDGGSADANTDSVTTFPPRNELSGRLVSTAYTGVSTQYQVALDDDREVQVYEQNLERALGARHRPIGERVRLSWSPEDTFAVAASDSGDSSATSSASAATVDAVDGERAGAPVTNAPSPTA
jgi:spermidine/putrescine transport system ATP-binding protein